MALRHRHKQAARAVGAGGFVRIMARHVAMFYPRGGTLVVGFDNMKSRTMPGPAFPWGYDAIRAAGHSHLGVMMARRNDWFRHRDLALFFDDLSARGFFAGFDRVVFYGASMGGFGALSFSAACPGADVFVFAPQTSLDPGRVPFETRYRKGYARGDWQGGSYTDGAVSAKDAGRVTVIADPQLAVDAAHVGRLPADRLIWLRARNFGHNPARLLKHMGILGQVCRAGWDGTLTQARFTALRRAGRAQGQSLARHILLEALERGHDQLAEQALAQLAVSHPDWQFPRFNRAIENRRIVTRWAAE
ncbi:hypothetical protein E4Z66_05525 [Aliishimia ponticola]|uniref:Phosphoadenosine phosphosulfate reductase n=1 Tax=Aliishimia ponticola TaxID=2499833 RepID=A0A4S4NJS4_9RHOB|nr:hypothetical protein [Aliishimia ponticola]THH39017.1 hypothetical protein E4Z66_05525 [Aliishimia ponticola]